MQPTSQHNTSLPPLPPRGTGTLVPLSQGNPSGASNEVGLWDQFTTKITLVFNNLFSDQPSILILPEDMIKYIFTNITDEKDLVSFTITCRNLLGMKHSPDIKLRIVGFKAIGRAGDKLIHAVNARPLTPVESLDLGVPAIVYCNAAQQQIAQEKTYSAETLETVLFENFKHVCLTNKITGEDFYSVAAAVAKILNKKATSFKNKEVFLVKLKTVIKTFNGKICLDRIDTYAKQSIEMITPGSFNAQVAELKAFLPHINKIDIEDRLRSRIKGSHDLSIKRLGNQYRAPSLDAIEKLKYALQHELEQSKTAPGMTVEQLYEIDTKLANIDATVQMEAQKLGQFYKEIENA